MARIAEITVTVICIFQGIQADLNRPARIGYILCSEYQEGTMSASAFCIPGKFKCDQFRISCLYRLIRCHQFRSAAAAASQYSHGTVFFIITQLLMQAIVNIGDHKADHIPQLQ